MLGEDKAVNASLQQDTLGEIANIICGNALPAIFGFETVFHLEAPFICNGRDSINTGADFSQAAQAQISFESGVADVKLYTEKRALKNLPG